jgi:putative flippase GtrA
MLQSLKNTRVMEIQRFLVSGGVATLSHWLTMALLIIAGMLPAPATAIGAIIGAIVNYIAQKTFTFKSRKQHRITIPRYIAACAILWIANLVIFILLNESLSIAVVPAQFITTAIVAILSYWLYRVMVFSDSHLAAGPDSHE